MDRVDTLALKKSDKVIMILIAIGGGGVVSLILPILWEGIKSFTWLPFHDLLSLFMSAEIAHIQYLRPLILVILAITAAILLIIFSPIVRISDKEISIKKGSDHRIIKRHNVAGVYRKSGKIIIETTQGRKLFEDSIEGGKEKIRRTFIAHGYPWES